MSRATIIEAINGGKREAVRVIMDGMKHGSHYQTFKKESHDQEPLFLYLITKPSFLNLICKHLTLTQIMTLAAEKSATGESAKGYLQKKGNGETDFSTLYHGLLTLKGGSLLRGRPGAAIPLTTS